MKNLTLIATILISATLVSASIFLGANRLSSSNDELIASHENLQRFLNNEAFFFQKIRLRSINCYDGLMGDLTRSFIENRGARKQYELYYPAGVFPEVPFASIDPEGEQLVRNKVLNLVRRWNQLCHDELERIELLSVEEIEALLSSGS